MGETKAFAALTSGLLARKGAARPAMRPQEPGRPGAGQPAASATIEDLGWNDMGEATATRRHPGVRLPASLSGASISEPVVPEVVRQQDEIAREFASAAAVVAAAPPRATGRKAAFTLRLDAERHLRLRLACAVEARSAQQIVTAALDALLAGRPEIDRLAAQVSAAGEGGA